jgi:streptogramin lyase
MTRTVEATAIAFALCVLTTHLDAATINGKVVDASGKPLEGVTVSAFDEARDQSISVFSQADGSFKIDGLRDVTFNLRARLMGQQDEWQEDVQSGTTGISFAMKPAEGEDLEDQRTANSGFSMLKWDNHKDKENYKMMCTYCHQSGSRGWRTPERPVDWETMIRRMDGFGGLYKHTQQSLVKRLVATYSPEAVAKWPAFVPPAAPKGLATRVKITEWDMGQQFKVMIHDLELGPDGLVYAVDMSQNAIVTLDPATGERELYRFPGRYRGPHSIELGNDGHMWLTLCISGEMAKFDIKTKEFTIISSAEPPARRGSYPHTLRINPQDPEGLVWYTDAGRNSCFSLHPETLKVKEYKLLNKNQAVGAGKGESRGITPYGIDFSPVDGTIWYSKLNGNRIGRIDPNVEDGDIKEWNPPFRGPRRLHVAPDGIVWVPGFGSGVFGRFDPKTEEWKVYDLPDAENQIPYALNIDSKGYVWICGTGSDSLHRFDPKTEDLIEFRLPSRVTYTREIEFDAEGNVWTCNSNGPARHTERGYGSIIKLEIVGDKFKVAGN